jgi:hypothetical protein
MALLGLEWNCRILPLTQGLAYQEAHLMCSEMTETDILCGFNRSTQQWPPV